MDIMDKMTAERTPFMIATEINTIREQVDRAGLYGAIEIGRRLTEVKRLIPYGEWGKWLEGSVSYTERMAQKLMQIYRAYGEKEIAALEAGASPKALPNIGYTHALVLLAVPEEEREQFIQDLDVESMTVEELKKVVKERDQAKEEQGRTEQENAELRQALDEERGKNAELNMEQERMKKEGEELRKSKQGLEQVVEKKELENKKLKENANVKSYNRVSNQLNAAQVQILTGQVSFKYEAFDKAYKELEAELGALAMLDKDVHGAYVKKLDDYLAKRVRERMGK